RQPIGLDDNFFGVGGDSILSILLVSRARRAGLELTPRDVFEQPTVEALAAVARKSARPDRPVPDSGAGIGDVIPTPIMRWLFERGGPIGRFNQSMLLQVPADATEADLVAALQALLDAHDALRLSRGPDGTTRILARGAISAATCLASVDVSDLSAAARLT